MSALSMSVWVIVLAGLLGTTGTIWVMLRGGALAAGLGRRTATRVPTTMGIGWAAWVVASALLADADVFRFAPTRAVPPIPFVMLAGLIVVLLLTTVPVARRILARPDALWRLTLPQLFRPVGAAFLVAMAMGQLPAVFALPAGLGDIAIGVEAAFVARDLRRGVVGRGALWLNILGLVDLVVAFGIAFTAAPGPGRVLHVSASTEAISTLPLVLIPMAVVPLAVTLHVLSLRKLRAITQITTTATPVRSTP